MFQEFFNECKWWKIGVIGLSIFFVLFGLIYFFRSESFANTYHNPPFPDMMIDPSQLEQLKQPRSKKVRFDLQQNPQYLPDISPASSMPHPKGILSKPPCKEPHGPPHMPPHGPHGPPHGPHGPPHGPHGPPHGVPIPPPENVSWNDYATLQDYIPNQGKTGKVVTSDIGFGPGISTEKPAYNYL